jgi:hypothetical protein
LGYKSGTTTGIMKTQAVQIVNESREVLQGVRAALIELYASLGADPAEPQEVSRRFEINRNLTWKLSRVISADDPLAALNHLPGNNGIQLALKAFEKAGAAKNHLGGVESAVRRLNDLIEFHADGRDEFELTLESMGLFEREARVESGRELAFRGNSMIWGVQARARLLCSIVAPQKNDPSKQDFAQIGALVGFRRLRPEARWRLFRYQLHDDQGKDLSKQMRPEELVDKGADVPPLLMPQFCSPNMPALDVIDGPDGREFVLPGGPVGKRSAFDCFLGYVARGFPAFAKPGNEHASAASPITLPVETLILDVLLHKDISIPTLPEVLVYGFPHGGMDNPAAQGIHNQLPCAERVTELAGQPPAVANAIAPQYAKVVESVYARLGWSPSDFRGYRLEYRFPPMSSRVVVRWDLMQAP